MIFKRALYKKDYFNKIVILKINIRRINKCKLNYNSPDFDLTHIKVVIKCLPQENSVKGTNTEALATSAYD